VPPPFLVLASSEKPLFRRFETAIWYISLGTRIAVEPPLSGRLLKPSESKMEGAVQVRFYRVCTDTSQILQLEERPWSVSTAIVAVREPSRTGNRGAAAPIFWPGRRCLPELAEGDRKVGCRRPTFLKSAKRRQMIWFSRLGSHVFSDARERMDVLYLGMGTPPRESAIV
jgi:hypothetical protein